MYTSLISPKELAQNFDDPNWRIVDCRFSLDDTERGRRDYNEAHIPNAIYAHLNDDLSASVIPGKTGRHPLPKIDDLAKLFSQWGIDENVQVVAYDDASGAIAARLWWLLRWLGHDRVAVLDGGFDAWNSAGYPVSDKLFEPVIRNFTPAPRPEFLVDINTLEKRMHDNNWLVVDSRSSDRYSGKNETIDPVAGHIPNAVNAPYADNLNSEGKFLEKPALYKRFRELLDEHAASNAIFYCGSGVTACHNLLAMHHAGLGDGKLYAGSWSEWIIDSARLIVKEA